MMNVFHGLSLTHYTRGTLIVIPNQILGYSCLHRLNPPPHLSGNLLLASGWSSFKFRNTSFATTFWRGGSSWLLGTSWLGGNQTFNKVDRGSNVCIYIWRKTNGDIIIIINNKWIIVQSASGRWTLEMKIFAMIISDKSRFGVSTKISYCQIEISVWIEFSLKFQSQRGIYSFAF